MEDRNRAAQQAEAERYVDWLESRAGRVAGARAAEAERIDHEAKLAGSDRTYGQGPSGTPAPRATEADGNSAYDSGCTPGCGHPPMR